MLAVSALQRRDLTVDSPEPKPPKDLDAPATDVDVALRRSRSPKLGASA